MNRDLLTFEVDLGGNKVKTAMAEKTIKERALKITTKKFKLKKSTSGENAGIIGIATLVQNYL